MSSLNNPFGEENTPSKPIVIENEKLPNYYKLSINVGPYSNLHIELNDLTTEGREDIVSKIKMAKTIVSKFGIHEEGEVKQ